MTALPPDSPATPALARVFAGDAAAMAEAWAFDDEAIESAYDELGRPALTASAVVRALKSLGQVDDVWLERWAWFFRLGLMPDPTRPPRVALDVDWGPEFEEETALALSRLSELGDMVDGTISPDERDRLIAQLERSDES